MSMLVTPRIAICSMPPSEAICTFGRVLVRPRGSLTPASFKSSPDSTDSAIGVLLAGCATFCAVTITSCTPPSSAGAGAWVWAMAAVAPDKKPTARSDLASKVSWGTFIDISFIGAAILECRSVVFAKK